MTTTPDGVKPANHPTQSVSQDVFYAICGAVARFFRRGLSHSHTRDSGQHLCRGHERSSSSSTARNEQKADASSFFLEKRQKAARALVHAPLAIRRCRYRYHPYVRSYVHHQYVLLIRRRPSLYMYSAGMVQGASTINRHFTYRAPAIFRALPAT